MDHIDYEIEFITPSGVKPYMWISKYYTIYSSGKTVFNHINNNINIGNMNINIEEPNIEEPNIEQLN